jgi:integrase
MIGRSLREDRALRQSRRVGGAGRARSLLDEVDLHDADDLRHTYATWLEDAGIPAPVIDELMGHEATGRDHTPAAGPPAAIHARLACASAGCPRLVGAAVAASSKRPA